MSESSEENGLRSRQGVAVHTPAGTGAKANRPHRGQPNNYVQITPQDSEDGVHGSLKPLAQSLQFKLWNILKSLVYEPPKTDMTTPLLSSNGIKHLFDTLRNFTLITVLCFGALHLWQNAETASSMPWVWKALGVVLGLLVPTFILLNLKFLQELVVQNPMVQQSERPQFWSKVWHIIGLGFSCLLLLAAIFSRN